MGRNVQQRLGENGVRMVAILLPYSDETPVMYASSRNEYNGVPKRVVDTVLAEGASITGVNDLLQHGVMRPANMIGGRVQPPGGGSGCSTILHKANDFYRGTSTEPPPASTGIYVFIAVRATAPTPGAVLPPFYMLASPTNAAADASQFNFYAYDAADKEWTAQALDDFRTTPGWEAEVQRWDAED